MNKENLRIASFSQKVSWEIERKIARAEKEREFFLAGRLSEDSGLYKRAIVAYKQVDWNRGFPHALKVAVSHCPKLANQIYEEGFSFFIKERDLKTAAELAKIMGKKNIVKKTLIKKAKQEERNGDFYEAARIYENLGDKNRAARTYLKNSHGNRAYLVYAADLYEEMGEFEKAAELQERHGGFPDKIRELNNKIGNTKKVAEIDRKRCSSYLESFNRGYVISLTNLLTQAYEGDSIASRISREFLAQTIDQIGNESHLEQILGELPKVELTKKELLDLACKDENKKQRVLKFALSGTNHYTEDYNTGHDQFGSYDTETKHFLDQENPTYNPESIALAGVYLVSYKFETLAEGDKGKIRMNLMNIFEYYSAKDLKLKK